MNAVGFKLHNRPWAMFINGELAGLFHTEKQAKASKTAICAAFFARKEPAPHISIDRANARQAEAQV